MARFKLVIEYAGTRYSGWQIQTNARTVQGEIERALRVAARTDDVTSYGSGRTDAGVHAMAQVAHADVTTTLPADALRRAVNETLPADIHVLSMQQVPHRFHARHDAVARSYIYQIARRRTAFAKPFVWWVKDPLDVGLMRQTAAAFVGHHDFRSFSDDDPLEKSTEVLLETLDIHEDGDLIIVHLEGSHFIWKMVRRVVGILVAVGTGTMTPAVATGMLVSDSDVPARLTAPASGLFLERVYYPGDRRDLPVQPASVVARYVPSTASGDTERRGHRAPGRRSGRR